MLRFTWQVLKGLIKKVVSTLVTRSARYGTGIKELRRLDDRTLEDIGLNRDDVELLRRGYMPSHLVRESVPKRRREVNRRKSVQKGAERTTELRKDGRSMS